MDYAAWKLFIDAADLGSLSKAAVAYGTSQPHISRQIVELEQYCGGRLFQRTGRGVVLSELGARIAPRVERGLPAPNSCPTTSAVRRASQSAWSGLDFPPPLIPLSAPFTIAFESVIP